MAWGTLANIAVTALASAAYWAAAIAAQAKQRRLGRATGPTPVFLALIGLFLLLASLRQVAAQAGSTAWDLRIYFLNVPFAALVIIPHVYLVTQIQTGSDRRAGQVALGFLLVIATGVAFAFLGGVEAQPRTDYGTDWELRSAVAGVLIAAAILLPGIGGSGWLLYLSRRLDAASARRIRLLGLSSLGYFVLFTLDAYGLSGPLFLTARILTAATGALAWYAVADPHAPASAGAPTPTQQLYRR